MPCFHPLRAFRPPPGAVSRQLIFSKIELAHLEPVRVSCGQCIGCRLEKSRQWAVRCVHEASLYPSNCFITLTYSNEHLPSDGSLHKDHFQKFMKRLRKKFGGGIRYFMCGEYGEKFGRPHYHACLFNFDFPDRELYRIRDGVRLDVSAELSKLWKFGFATVGNVTFESAAYVARYITKKVTGGLAEHHYKAIEWVEVSKYRSNRKKWRAVKFEKQPEYCTMSRGGRGKGQGGVGAPWLRKYMTDVYPHDRVVLTGGEEIILSRPPKFYDSIFELDDPLMMEEIRAKREQARKLHSEDCTPERLKAREQHQLARFSKLKRGYDNG